MANIWHSVESWHWLEWRFTWWSYWRIAPKNNPNTTWHNILKPLHGQNRDKPCNKNSWYIRKHLMNSMSWIFPIRDICPSTKKYNDEKTTYQQQKTQKIWETPLETTILNMNGRRQRFHSHHRQVRVHLPCWQVTSSGESNSWKSTWKRWRILMCLDGRFLLQLLKWNTWKGSRNERHATN